MNIIGGTYRNGSPGQPIWRSHRVRPRSAMSPGPKSDRQPGRQAQRCGQPGWSRQDAWVPHGSLHVTNVPSVSECTGLFLRSVNKGCGRDEESPEDRRSGDRCAPRRGSPPSSAAERGDACSEEAGRHREDRGVEGGDTSRCRFSCGDSMGCRHSDEACARCVVPVKLRFVLKTR
jgi:hypothetical protein